MTEPIQTTNSVHYYEGDDSQSSGWYFWDETGSDRYGPYETEAKANEECAKYAATL